VFLLPPCAVRHHPAVATIFSVHARDENISGRGHILFDNISYFTGLHYFADDAKPLSPVQQW
jgi:hypothetical protein